MDGFYDYDVDMKGSYDSHSTLGNQMFAVEASPSTTLETEKTSNILIEVFQNSSSKWSKTCGAPQRESRPSGYEAVSPANAPPIHGLSAWNGDGAFTSYQREESSFHCRFTVTNYNQEPSAQGFDLSASLDPVPLPTMIKVIKTFHQPEMLPPPTTSMANARAEEHLGTTLQRSQPPLKDAECDESMCGIENGQLGWPSSLVQAFDATLATDTTTKPEEALLPPLSSPWCQTANHVDESYETLQRLFLTSSSNEANSNINRRGQSVHGHSVNSFGTMESPLDELYLNPFHCFLRKQIVIFEATHDDIGKIQGRNKGLALHQVGLGCRYCTPHRNTDRYRGATYHPTKLNTIYQTAQNLAKNHFFRNCPNMPQDVKDELKVRASQITKSNRGGGKQYWSNVLQISGIEERDGGLFYKS